jgi:tRNA(adenine34) deaminase
MMTELEFIPEKIYMEKALELAKTAYSEGEIPVGAVIVKNSTIIGSGRNRRESKKNALWHAEIEAISEACREIGTWRLSGCCLYVTLEPCLMCTGAAENARIDRIVFGADRIYAGSGIMAAGDIPARNRPQLYRGFMEEECSALLKEFFSEIR